ncbi:dolichyl-phosphate beta-glucosyltransferase [Pyrinomonas sp.]|uniref:dolichyl-phosphate beta-glucosyltransferase n=1 Tax=Pyrinomonas sp. TaxID=2080306 RepID=UPI003324D0AD
MMLPPLLLAKYYHADAPRLKSRAAGCLCYIALRKKPRPISRSFKIRVGRASRTQKEGSSIGKMSLALSVVIPAYNEAARLDKTLEQVIAYLDEFEEETELIVVDDGSQDRTAAVAEDAFARARRVEARLIRYEQNRGKGYAVRTGLLAARAPVALFSDADLSTPIAETPKVVAPIRNGDYDLVFGSRALDRRLIGVHQPWRREQGGRLFNLIVRLATGLPFWDTQCGFKAFRLSVCRPIIEAATVDRFGFDVELLFVAHRAGLRLLERAVRWDHNEGSKVSVARDSLRMLNEVRAIRRNARLGVYDEAIARARKQAASETLAPQTLSDVPEEIGSRRL